MKYDLGFLGGGQLARMSIQAAQRMGLRCLSLDPGANTPASQVSDAVQGELTDPLAIAEVVSQCEHVTLENEFIPADAIREAFRSCGRDEGALLPGIDTLDTIQDKLSQRNALNKAGVPSPNAAALVDPDILLSRAIDDADSPWQPVVMKARFGGYDGKGTRYGRTREEFAQNLPIDDLGPRPSALPGWLIEDYVPFRRELAVMVYVGPRAKGAFPTMETVQTNHVCDLVYPCDADAQEIGIAAVEAVGGHGLFGVELFQLENGELLVNEIAPRPHNTGHYTLDWGGTSQFEQHVRLAMGLPIDFRAGHPACMANLLGPPTLSGDLNLKRALDRALAFSGVYVHWYGKAPRSGRKLGHLNVVGVPNLVQSALEAREAFFAN